MSEFVIVNAAMSSGHVVAVGLFLSLLGIVFVGMGATVLAVVQGDDAATLPPTNGFHDTIFTAGPILIFMSLVFLMGVYVPPPLESLLRDAAAFVEAKP